MTTLATKLGALTGTSTTPTTVAEWKSNKLIAAATASSKQFDASMMAHGQAIERLSPTGNIVRG